MSRLIDAEVFGKIIERLEEETWVRSKEKRR